MPLLSEHIMAMRPDTLVSAPQKRPGTPPTPQPSPPTVTYAGGQPHRAFTQSAGPTRKGAHAFALRACLRWTRPRARPAACPAAPPSPATARGARTACTAAAPVPAPARGDGGVSHAVLRGLAQRTALGYKEYNAPSTTRRSQQRCYRRWWLDAFESLAHPCMHSGDRCAQRAALPEVLPIAPPSPRRRSTALPPRRRPRARLAGARARHAAAHQAASRAPRDASLAALRARRSLQGSAGAWCRAATTMAPCTRHCERQRGRPDLEGSH